MKTALGLALTAVAMFAQSEHSVTAVRTWSLAASTRIAVEVSGTFEYKYERLHNPERVYFDIKGATPLIDGKRSLNQPVEDKLVQRIRVAETAPGVTRVVLDIASEVEVRPSQLTNPSRLLIELRIPNAVPNPATIIADPPPPKDGPPVGKPAPVAKADLPKVNLPRPALPVEDQPPVIPAPIETTSTAGTR